MIPSYVEGFGDVPGFWVRAYGVTSRPNLLLKAGWSRLMEDLQFHNSLFMSVKEIPNEIKNVNGNDNYNILALFSMMSQTIN